jgi:hypothetical protein
VSETNRLRLGKAFEVGISRNKYLTFSFYFNVKAGIFHYKDQSLNNVQGKCRSLLKESHEARE